MKQGRFSEEQIIAILKEAEAGAKVTELCRRHGISDATFYTWRSKYGGLEISEMRRLRQLAEENRRFKRADELKNAIPITEPRMYIDVHPGLLGYHVDRMRDTLRGCEKSCFLKLSVAR